jgi:hypothetical protein
MGRLLELVSLRTAERVTLPPVEASLHPTRAKHAVTYALCARLPCAPAGGLVRHIMKQLEECGLMEKAPEKGRRLTANGQRDMDQIAGRITVQLQTFF